MAHSSLTELVELVELAYTGKTDAVIDLTDLVQSAGGVLGSQQDAIDVHDCHGRPPTRYAFARVVCLVLHQLFRRYVKRHAHGRCPCSVLRVMRALKRSATSVSAIWL